MRRLGVLAWAALWLRVLPSTADEAEVVISQIYGGGGNSGAPYQNDFVELFNRGTNMVILDGWSIQYAAAASANWRTAVLEGVIEPGQFFLIQLAAGGSQGVALPTPDASGAINLSATQGKVALVRHTNSPTSACPDSLGLVDVVGYGREANCFQGSGPTAQPSNADAVRRISHGCRDSGDNASDFFVGAPLPRNRQAPLVECSTVAVSLPLHAIQGRAALSSFDGEWITTTTNVITAVVGSGFFIQASESEMDDDPATAEAMFVAAPVDALAVAVSNAVVVAGVVEETNPHSIGGLWSRTQLHQAKVTLVSKSQPLPGPILITSNELAPSGGIDQLEHLEAMRVRADSLMVIAPTGGFGRDSTASSISDGVFYAVLSGLPRPRREPGIPILTVLPAEAPPTVERFDGNPERIRVDSNAQNGALRVEVTAGAAISNLVGILDFARNAWTLLPDPGVAMRVADNQTATPVPAPGPNEFTVAALNFERFYDADDDPSRTDDVLDPEAFAGRLTKASHAIRDILRSPDILGLEEVENLETLRALADRIDADAAAIGQPIPCYQAWLLEGNDIGGINVGFLLKTNRLRVIEVIQVGKADFFVNPVDEKPALLHDRPPLVLRASVVQEGSEAPLNLTVILNHLRSLSGVEDAADGARVRAKRRAQAEALARLIQERQSHSPHEGLIVMGDFNAFEFSDGYVDVMGTIKGSPAEANRVILASPDLVDPDLANLTETLPPGERYSYVFDGNAQAIDHILVNVALRSRVSRYVYARIGADYPESWRGDSSRPERLSDHDAPIAYLTLNTRPRLNATVQRDGGGVEIRWIAEPSRTNRIEVSADLESWTVLGTAVVSEDGDANFVDMSAPPAAVRFYRIAVP